MLYALVPLNQLGALAGNQGQPRLMPMGGQGLSSSYTGWCDSAGANCTTFDGSNGGVQVVDIGYNYPRDTDPNTFTIDTQYGGGPMMPVA